MDRSKSTVQKEVVTQQEDMIRVVVPYTEGMSEDIRRVCRDYNVRVVFRSGPTLRNIPM